MRLFNIVSGHTKYIFNLRKCLYIIHYSIVTGNYHVTQFKSHHFDHTIGIFSKILIKTETDKC